MLTKVPVTNPRNPIRNKNAFLIILKHPISCQFVIVSIIGGAIKAKVDELIAPTREIKRSNFGIAAARETEILKNSIVVCLLRCSS